MNQDTQIIVGQILTGSQFNEPMRVETAQASGPGRWVVGLVGTQSERFRKVTLTADDLASLMALDPRLSFDGDGRLLRLGLQAYALGIAYFARAMEAGYPVAYAYLARIAFFRGRIGRAISLMLRGIALGSRIARKDPADPRLLGI